VAVDCEIKLINNCPEFLGRVDGLAAIFSDVRPKNSDKTRIIGTSIIVAIRFVNQNNQNFSDYFWMVSPLPISPHLK